MLNMRLSHNNAKRQRYVNEFKKDKTKNRDNPKSILNDNSNLQDRR